MTQSTVDHAHALIGRLYELPTHNMYNKLLVVSMPGWLPAADVDLIKRALKELADRETEPRL